MSPLRDVLLKFADVTVGYADVAVVRHAMLAVRSGEILGLVGPNGAGKSTLLRAVTGDCQVLEGQIEVAGRQLTELSARERARLVGVVPQQVSAAFSLPASEFVELARDPHLPRFGNPGPDDHRAVAHAMEITDTLGLADQPVDALSGGDLQRLALAQALAAEPQLLLLDEATAHLDLNHRMQVLDLMRHLADGGLAVLAVFHDLDLAARYSDRIAVVSDGQVCETGTPERIITAETVRRVFGVRAVVGRDAVTGSVSVTPVLRDGAVEDRQRGHVMVIGGAGSAAPLMRRLVLAGWSVTAGALNTGDADAVVADALDVEYAAIPPFAPMDAASAIATATLAAAADAIVVCEVPFGHGNIDNLLVAVRAGKPMILIGDIDGRDFTGGAGDSYWIEAVRDGATVVPDAEAAQSVLDGLRPVG